LNATPATGLVATLIGFAMPLFLSGAFSTSFGLPANGESVQPEELENYRYDNDDTDNIKDVVTHCCNRISSHSSRSQKPMHGNNRASTHKNVSSALFPSTWSKARVPGTELMIASRVWVTRNKVLAEHSEQESRPPHELRKNPQLSLLSSFLSDFFSRPPLPFPSDALEGCDGLFCCAEGVERREFCS
jgi:hypothetical protein